MARNNENNDLPAMGGAGAGAGAVLNNYAASVVPNKSGIGKEVTKPVKKVLRALSRKIQNEYKKANAEIQFRELYVDNTKRLDVAYGESVGVWRNAASSIERLAAHIHTLMKLTNAEHRKDFCEKDVKGGFHLKERYENTITRLTMNEFSLYTQAPLTIQQYERLVRMIEEFAAELEPNVHIQLGSMALVNDHNELVNITTYIQGTVNGLPAEIRTICKNSASKIDINYGGHYKCATQYGLVGLFPDFNSNGFVDSTGHANYTASVFEVTTAGGAKYTQAVDICLDHFYRHSYEQVVEKISLKNPDPALPLQAEHLVTSNRVNAREDCLISTKMVQADPVGAAMGESGFECLGLAERAHLKTKSTSSMGILSTNTGYQVKYPPFGFDYMIRQHRLRKAGKLKAKFRIKNTAKMIKGIIQRVKKHAKGIATLRECMSCAVGVIESLVQADCLTIDDDLLQLLLRYACLTEDTEMMSCLLQLNGFDHKQLIARSIDCGEEILLKAILASKYIADKNTGPQVSIINVNMDLNNYGQTPLLRAVSKGNLAMVKLLLANGANTNLAFKNGSAPLYIAIARESEAIVVTLLAAGANPNRVQKNAGWTALHFAAKKNNATLVNLLLAAGANPFILSKSENTAYQMAVGHGCTACAKLLEKAMVSSARKVVSGLFKRSIAQALTPIVRGAASDVPVDGGVDDIVPSRLRIMN